MLYLPKFKNLWRNLQGSFQLKKKDPIKLNHLALIMDGNRRWAHKRNLSAAFGHNQGIKTVKQLIEFCLEHTISTVSIYTFSLENFNRPKIEIDTLFDLMIEESKQLIPELIKEQIKVVFIGDKNYFPQRVISTIENIEQTTKNLTRLRLNILFCYGGRQEIVAAIKDIVQDVKTGVLKDPVTDKIFETYLWSSHIPDPDLIIRTGGAKRLSNFLLYKAAYSELYFTDRLWPDLTKKDLEDALADFIVRKRNYGA